jgi:hypothetical protein
VSFSQPSAPNTGDKFNAADHKGALLLVYPKRFEQDVKTTKGLSDAADVDIVIVDRFGPDGKPLAFHGARLFGNLARSVRNDLGGQVLGRLNQITSANGNTPWILENFTDQDAVAATPVHQAYQQGQFRPTENPMAPPQAAAPQQAWTPPAAAAPPYPTPAPTAPAPQQWQTPAPAAPAPVTPQAAPAWQGAPSPAPAAPAIDPNLVAYLAQRGVTLPPTATQAEAVAIANSLQ